MLSLPPELQVQVFLQCRSYDDAFNLQLSCKQLHAIFRQSQQIIREHLNDNPIARQLRRYYEFLQKLKFDNDTIMLPPPGGWPISAALWKRRGKSEYALKIVRTLPYLQSGCWSSVGYKSSACLPNCNDNVGSGSLYEEDVMKEMYGQDWKEDPESDDEYTGTEGVTGCGTEHNYPEGDEDHADESSENDGADDDDDEDEDDEDDGDECQLRMKHLIAMFEGHESGGQEVLLDTLNGTVYEEIVRMGGGDHNVSLEEYIDQRISMYTNLEEVFGPDDEPVCVRGDLDFEKIAEEGEPDDNRSGRWIAYLYHKHGWPGEGYRKEECKAAVDQYWSKDYD